MFKREEMLAERENVVPQCLLQKKVIIKDKKEEVLESGPCGKIDGEKCSAYIKPSAKWRLGDCNLATHLINIEDEKRKILNPIKKSKRR